MKKSELIDAVSKVAGVSKGDAGKVISALPEIACAQVASGHDFTIPSLIRMSVQTRAARNGVHPKTQERIRIPERRVIKPRVASQIVEAAQ